jgi:hypothetical protein
MFFIFIISKELKRKTMELLRNILSNNWQNKTNSGFRIKQVYINNKNKELKKNKKSRINKKFITNMLSKRSKNTKK